MTGMQSNSMSLGDLKAGNGVMNTETNKTLKCVSPAQSKSLLLGAV